MSISSYATYQKTNVSPEKIELSMLSNTFLTEKQYLKRLIFLEKIIFLGKIYFEKKNRFVAKIDRSYEYLKVQRIK